MKIAIMQPYLFPYIGYFQLINSVDRFVIYDDVNFIKQGWVNRNNILVAGKSMLFTVPLKKQSSYLKINEVFINEKLFILWKKKFLRTLEQNYKKAPFFNQVFNIVNKVFGLTVNDIAISNLAVRSLLEICVYLKIKTEIVLTSSVYSNQHLAGKERVIDICKKEGASQYINPIGGQELYDKNYFKENDLELNFIKSLPIEYEQFNNSLVPWLSIIDVLMFNSIEEIKLLLDKYQLV